MFASLLFFFHEKLFAKGKRKHKMQIYVKIGGGLSVAHLEIRKNTHKNQYHSVI